MPGDSFTQKKIDVLFNIASTGQTLTVTGHRVSCQVVNAAQATGAQCTLRIEGMLPSMMNQLSVMQSGYVLQGQNTVMVQAGDATNGMSTVFQGAVVLAFVDYANAPNVAFHVEANSMGIPQMQPIAVTSYPSGASVADICQAIATKLQIGFQNNGVTQTLAGGLYFHGTGAQQLDSVSQASKITYNIALNILNIYPPGIVQSTTASTFTISSGDGLVSYPSYNQSGVELTVIFNPQIGFWSTINLESLYPPEAWLNGNSVVTSTTSGVKPSAEGIWIVMKVQHDLESETPDGPWFTDIIAARPANASNAFAQ